MKYKKRDNVVVCFFGDGAANTGAFHEGLNMASLMKVPVIFVCENNQFAMSMRADKSVAARSIAERAAFSYDMSTFTVDGNDILAVYNATLKAIEKIEKEGEPVFMECLTYRMKGHSVHRQPKRDEELEAWERKDPITMFSKKLLDAEIVAETEVKAIWEEIDREIKDAVDLATKSPTLPFEELEKLVYAGGWKG